MRAFGKGFMGCLGVGVAIIVVIVIVVAVSHGSSSPNSSTSTKPVALGQAVKATDSSGATATITVTSVTFATSGKGVLAQPPANGFYAVANVLVQGTGGQYPYDPVYLKYQEPDGTTYQYASGNSITAGFDPLLQSGTIGPGQKAQGNVVFDVKTKGGILQMSDSLGNIVGQWTIPAN